MRLKEVKISGFRSIQNEAVLLVDSNITILIGANDHGKTNILKAIAALNDDAPFTPDDQNWDTEGNQYPHVEWLFELTPEEQQEFSSLAMQAETSNAPTPKAETSNLTLLTSKQLTEVRFCRSGVSSAVDITEKGLSKTQKEFLLKARPRVELFSNPQKGSIDSVTRAQLDDDQYEFMKGLFMKAGLWEISDKIFQLNTKTSKLLDDASQKLTRILQKEWEQGKNLSWKFKHSGNGSVIEIEIIDPSVSNQYVRPSQRSSGFTAFFVTNLALFARTNTYQSQSYIYLFDEPGTYLHPIAQINLQRVFESLAEETQILYSTHSIFMVSKNSPIRNRVIQKTTDGTVIDKKPYARNWKAVRESLGIILAQNFLIADRILLVEGPSDEVYVATILSYLVHGEVIDIDLNEFCVVDAGDWRNYVAMAKLMLEEGRTVICLLDNDSHGKLVRDNLEKIASKEIKEEKLILHLLPENCSTEDVLPHKDILIEGFVSITDQLVQSGIITLADGETTETIKKKVADIIQKKKTVNKTLGAQINELCAAVFKDGSTLSKVALSAYYADKIAILPQESASKIHKKDIQDILELKDKLGLNKRKAEKKIIENSE